MLAKLCTRSAVRRCAGTGVLALALLGSALPVRGAAAASSAPAGPDLSRFYRQEVAWGACAGPGTPKGLQCGKVTVPLDYARPATGTLDLALARIRGTGGSHQSVLLNFGGPGGAGVSELTYDAAQFVGLANGYDVVTFDPRGVGRSSPVSCGGGGDQAAAVTGADADLGHPQALLRQLKRSADACARSSGDVLPYVGTVNAARDLDVIRQALGDEKLNYLGFSYGTRLGAVYAAQFPHRVGRMALDGVDTLTESLAEQGIAGARGQQTALDDFLDWCVTGAGCPFGQDRSTAGEAVVGLVRALDRRPVTTEGGDPFSGQDLVAAIVQALYSRDLWPSLERALGRLAQDGDPRGVMGFAAGGAGPTRVRRAAGHSGLVDPQDIPADNLQAALLAINCADDPDRPSAARITEDLGRLRAAYDQASPVFGRYRLTQVLMCYGRPRGTDFIRTRVKDVDTARMLLVGTRGDPATPYPWAVQTAERLGPSAVVLDNKGDGHTGYGSSVCVHRLVDEFLLNGSLPANGSSCPADGKEWSAIPNRID
ncbi:protease [Streptomyces hygroscopicus subsp. hygroscopicus]|uniref:alpha/beta hydrolase n=1 Tax=Streptomyces sp. KHY 26 TaxID=3097359 RepID=UPI0024A1E797|nr:alpha/beta hydrolase [Streptomyces hygroscopicus]GLX50787.1 protease [Streptomyces hygroscopicus subsp. hygroscopicus]